MVAEAAAAPISVEWLMPERIPEGLWPFLIVSRNTLVEIKEFHLKDTWDVTEGLGSISISGLFEAYKQVILRRVLDLSQATATTWNVGHTTGAIVCARALLETFGSFHHLFEEAKILRESEDYHGLGDLIFNHINASSVGKTRTVGKKGGDITIGHKVRRLIKSTEPDKEHFWHQISDAAHPNGNSMFAHFFIKTENGLILKKLKETEKEIFPAIYNCLYTLCWFYNELHDFDTFLDKLRYTD
nr:hypothetical protein [uncultured Roseococcus sp.]